MKKLLIIASVLFIFSCKNSEPKQTESIYNDETVLVVNYQLENMTLDQHAELGLAVAPNFTSENVPGLVGKSFIGDVERGVFGGVYYFSSLESVNTYLESSRQKTSIPNITSLKKKINIGDIITFRDEDPDNIFFGDNGTIIQAKIYQVKGNTVIAYSIDIDPSNSKKKWNINNIHNK